MTTHWLVRIGEDTTSFVNSSSKSTWGCDSSSPHAKHFLRTAKTGDRIWFVKSKSHGLLIAVATFTGTRKRDIGPLISFTATNEDLGWTRESEPSDTEIHYKDLYNVSSCNLLSHIKSPITFRVYDEKCKVNLPQEYNNIVIYSKVTNKM